MNRLNKDKQFKELLTTIGELYTIIDGALFITTATDEQTSAINQFNSAALVLYEHAKLGNDEAVSDSLKTVASYMDIILPAITSREIVFAVSAEVFA